MTAFKPDPADRALELVSDPAELHRFLHAYLDEEGLKAAINEFHAEINRVHARSSWEHRGGFQ